MMYLTDYENNFKSWKTYKELLMGLSFLDRESELEKYLSHSTTYLNGFEATEFARLMYKGMPKSFKSNFFIDISESWNSDFEIARVREWLFQRRLSFDQTIYMLYDENIIKTKWKVFVKYWDIFSWSVGMSLIILSPTRNWMLEVHHERVINFYSMEG